MSHLYALLGWEQFLIIIIFCRLHFNVFLMSWHRLTIIGILDSSKDTRVFVAGGLFPQATRYQTLQRFMLKHIL